VAVAGAGAADGHDRFGLGWRSELAAGILAHLDRIDVIEVIAEDYFDAGRADLRALQTLAAQVNVVLHGTSLGLASTVPLAPKRLDRLARLVEASGAEGWSEHLAFVRGGGIEIGHLAAPPRTEASIEGARRNIERATRIIGCAPLVENIATLVAPPASRLDEAEWTRRILCGAGAGLLLDLHIFTPMPSISATIRMRCCVASRSSKWRPCISPAGAGSTDRTGRAACSMIICTMCRRPCSRCCASSDALPRSR
jgi:uncharacterized protein